MKNNIDHLLYTTSKLEKGMDEIEELLGVRPVFGGRHPEYGTHNALLSLGDSIYLEVIAPDPSSSLGESSVVMREWFDEKSRLSTWALRTEKIEELTSYVIDNGLPLGIVKSGSRKKDDGTILSWKLTIPERVAFDGTIPFLISWGETPHPATVVPNAGELIGFEIEHPNAEQVSENLKLLGVNIQVNKAEKPKLIAKIKTTKGIVILT